jgi:hypothetical protein
MFRFAITAAIDFGFMPIVLSALEVMSRHFGKAPQRRLCPWTDIKQARPSPAPLRDVCGL